MAVGAFEGLEIIRSARLFRRKKLLDGATQRQTFLNFTGSDDSGNKGQFLFLCGSDDFFIQTRSQTELGSGVDRLLDLIRIEQGARSHQHLGTFLCDSTNRFLSRSRPEGDLDDSQSGRKQGLRQIHGPRRVFDHHNGDEPAFEQTVGQVNAHWRLAYPSLGTSSQRRSAQDWRPSSASCTPLAPSRRDQGNGSLSTTCRRKSSHCTLNALSKTVFVG